MLERLRAGQALARRFTELRVDALRLAAAGTVRQREAVAIVLASHATQDMAHALLSAHEKAAEPRVRIPLDRALGRSGAAEATDALIGDLSHPDEGVRVAAVEALGRGGDPRAAAPLARLLASGEGIAAEMSAGALARIGEPVAAFLASTWDAQGPRERRTIVAALERVPGGSVDAFLKERLEDPSPLVALEAARVLALRSDMAGRDLAVERLKSEDPGVAQAARAALDAIESAP